MPHFRAYLLLFLLLGCVNTAVAQKYAPDSEEAAVLAVVERLFDGMRAADSTVVRSVFAPGAALGRVGVRDGVTGVAMNDLDGFITNVGTPHDKVYDEHIWDPVILVDGPMAVAWTPYAFYLGEDFSHCGVNVFHLYRTDDGWKVFNLVDTARREGCEVPEGGGK